MASSGIVGPEGALINNPTGVGNFEASSSFLAARPKVSSYSIYQGEPVLTGVAPFSCEARGG